MWRGGGGPGMSAKKKADMSIFTLIGQTMPYIWSNNTRKDERICVLMRKIAQG